MELLLLIYLQANLFLSSASLTSPWMFLTQDQDKRTGYAGLDPTQCPKHSNDVMGRNKTAIAAPLTGEGFLRVKLKHWWLDGHVQGYSMERLPTVLPGCIAQIGQLIYNPGILMKKQWRGQTPFSFRIQSRIYNRKILIYEGITSNQAINQGSFDNLIMLQFYG